MKFLSVSKDGGDESTVLAYWLIEIKWLFSIVLLRFEDGTRDAYHSHAFNCFSWVLRGRLSEIRVGWDSPGAYEHRASWRPFITQRTHLHRVHSHGRSWVLSFRGPWARTWRELTPAPKAHPFYDGPTRYVSRTLTHGRREV